MSTVAMPEQSIEEKREQPRDVPLFNANQQKAFDRAFRKRDAKIRREFDAEKRHLMKDLIETVDLTEQLLDRCRDRISIEDQRAIRNGLQAIRVEYKENKCQTRR